MSPFDLQASEYATALAALETGAVICPVSPAGLLRFSGEESQLFLHNQLSSDVKALNPDQAQYSSYSTAKGRMQANFLLFQQEGDYWLQLADDLAPAMQKRLSMFILRSKTRCRDASAERVLLGLAGPRAAEFVRPLTGSSELTELAVHHGENGSVIALPGARFLLVIAPQSASDLAQRFIAAGCVPGNDDLWRLTDIRAGIPWICTATQEEFVLQMANLDLIGGVSFAKGCYPGQEIVARTRYLGKIKRRTLRVRCPSAAQAGQEVFSPEMNGQPSGKVLQAAPAEAGNFEMLVAAQLSSVEHGLHLDAIDGPALEPLPLPYAIE